VRCETAIGCDDALSAVLEEDRVVPFEARAHVRTCARCHRALARHRALRHDLQRLGRAPVPGEFALRGDALVASILAGLDLEDQRASRRARWISSCAVAGAVVGGVAAGFVAVARGRRLAAPL
jgi:anti-sigma factor RsiW